MLFLDQAGDAAAHLYANREAAAHYRHARDLPARRARRRRAHRREAGRRSLRLGRVDEAITVWLECLEWHRTQEDLERVADLHRKVGAALSHKGERKTAIEHYQKGINLLKDGPPRLELVRLYEEAAWLYLHTGDNMLAIYASEKALRLAERLGETRAASRAHGIFGRVFGRIGDTEKARQNLERAVELARTRTTPRRSWPCRRSGVTSRSPRRMSPRRAPPTRRPWRSPRRWARFPSQVELHASLAQLAVYTADWDQVERSTEASAELAEREGLVGKLCLPIALRGLLRWREGDLGESTVLFHRAHELAEQVGWSELAFQALFGLATSLRDEGDLPGAQVALDRALDVCERAGLIAQSIQATAARAVVLMLAHRRDAALEAAREAAELAERLHYPIGRAAALEAAGRVRRGPGRGGRAARAGCRGLGGAGPAARGRAVAAAGRSGVGAVDPERSRTILVEAAEEIEGLGVLHLAERARGRSPLG